MTKNEYCYPESIFCPKIIYSSVSERITSFQAFSSLHFMCQTEAYEFCRNVFRGIKRWFAWAPHRPGSSRCWTATGGKRLILLKRCTKRFTIARTDSSSIWSTFEKNVVEIIACENFQ